MNSNPNVKRLVQVSEEAAPAVHVPVIVGNEYYIITQQDVRRTEDTRFLSYSKLSSNGQLLPVTMPGVGSGGYQCESSLSASGGVTQSVGVGFANIEEIIKKLLNQHIDVETMNNNNKESEIDEECECRKPVATLSEQLKWSKSVNTSKPFPLTYTAATSTTDLRAQTHCKCCQISETSFTCTRGNNTNSNEKLTNVAVTQTDSQDLSAMQQQRMVKKTRFLCD